MTRAIIKCSLDSRLQKIYHNFVLYNVNVYFLLFVGFHIGTLGWTIRRMISACILEKRSTSIFPHLYPLSTGWCWAGHMWVWWWPLGGGGIIGTSRSSTPALLHFCCTTHPFIIQTLHLIADTCSTLSACYRDPGHRGACRGTNQFRSRILVCFFHWRGVELEPRKCRYGEHVENRRLWTE